MIGTLNKSYDQEAFRGGQLPQHIEFPHQRDMDALLEKQVQARMYFCECPLRRAHNMAWRARWNNLIKQNISKIYKFKWHKNETT